MNETPQIEGDEIKETSEQQEKNDTETTQQTNERLSYHELKKMEKQFAASFPDLSPEGILKTLKTTMTDIFGSVTTIQQALDILKNGENKESDQGKNELLYQRLKDNMGKEEKIEELKEQLQQEPKQETPPKENTTNNNSTNEQTQEKPKQKSESKLWKKTKQIVNRPLDHTRLGKYLIKKPLTRITKKKPISTEK